ncbi:MAG TPA: glycoside hydrolase family 38 C-terminal domain-containing protein [Gemmatimonadaceae bacterium]|nr:glycoside hydrolase family 38 C-terminal domain-containing protein [Gemmatimonadaceae bacterium]
MRMPLMMLRWGAVLVAGIAVPALPLLAQGPQSAQPDRTAVQPASGAHFGAHMPLAGPDLSKDPTLYVVGYAHLDTEWRWEYPQVISEYLPKTMHENFTLFKKYPHYIFNFSGANRYMMMKEYFPKDYATLKRYVAEGRWFPAGSSMEEGDVNAPSAEGIIRQILYGNEFFRKEFGKASAEYMLPDCFGFPWSLPSILAYSGIKGFSTQKLTWGSSVPDQPSTPPGMEGKGVPFNVGVWVGPDGKGVIAALNPGSYSGGVDDDLSTDTSWINRVNRDGKRWGVFADYHYYGTGDTGGAPDDSSVAEVEKSVTSDGPLHVISSDADEMFLDITPHEESTLPRYAGEMELQNHSAGSLTSEAYQKRWIRENEVLADAAEEASVAADWLGGRPYPMTRLNHAWRLMMGGHFHDIAAGTATPRSYTFAWNDDVIAMNQMASVLTSAATAVSAALDTRTQGTPLVVYNPLNIRRQDVVKATVPFTSEPRGVQVVGPDGQSVPAQLESWKDGQADILFLATMPSVGYGVYDVRAASAPAPSTGLSVTNRSLENARYRVTLNDNGDVSSIMDKTLHKELLRAPIRLALMEDTPGEWPAWNMDFDDEQRAPRGYVSGPATITVSDHGPVRVAITVSRQVDSSRFVQTISLAAGDAGNRVEFGNVIDWHMPATALKATFPLTASDSVATYNWDVGTIQRGNAYPRKFEVPSHQWFDLTDQSGKFGVTILSNYKNGSDKPNDNTLRLTLIRTPGIAQAHYVYSDQASQDFGHHEFTYGLASHAGDWRSEQTEWQGWRLNQPLIGFVASKHVGTLGKQFSFLTLSTNTVKVMAVKRAEASNEYVIRMVELNGKKESNVRIAFAAPVTSAREVNGQEQPMPGKVSLSHGAIVASFTPYQIRSFAVKLGPAHAQEAAPAQQHVALRYDRAVASTDGTHSVGGFNSAGEALPAELLPRTIAYDGITFDLAPAKTGTPNAIAASGQTITLPQGNFNRVYVLAASANGDQQAVFRVGNTPDTVTVQDWGGYIGQWDSRTFTKEPAPPPTAEEVAQRERRTARRDSAMHVRLDSLRAAGSGDTTRVLAGLQRMHRPRQPRMLDVMTGLTPGYIKRAPVAWYASHTHTASGANEPYAYSYLFAYEFDVPRGATTLTFPENNVIRVLAVTVGQANGELRPAHPLYDTLKRTGGNVLGAR